MKFVKFFLITLLAFSCTEPKSEAKDQNNAKAQPTQQRPPRKRPDFEKKQMKVEAKKITVEIADDPYKRGYGLMFITSMPEDQGMLFIFEQEQELGFWMKNTRIPLTIAYAKKDGTIIDLIDMQPASDIDPEPPTYPSSGYALYALEMNQGWFKKNGIKVGDKLHVP